MVKKNILYLRADLNPDTNVGGSVAHTLGVIRELVKNGNNVFCASSAMIEVLKTEPGIKFYELKNYKIFNFIKWRLWVLRERLSVVFSNVFFLFQILRFVKNQKIDFIYQRYSFFNLVGVLVKKIKKVPLVLEYNDSEVRIEAFQKVKSVFKFQRFSEYVERLNLKKADVISVVSKEIKSTLVKNGVSKEKILVNPNGVDVLKYNSKELNNKRVKIRKKLGWEKNFIFGFIGTFSYWHGINILEKIIPKALQEDSSARFLMVGDGPLLEPLKKSLEKLKDKIIFTGLVSHDDGRHFLSACDVFLCPTQRESIDLPFFGSPTKLFEYMSLAKPVIASGIEQLEEVISPALFVQDLFESKVVKNEVGILANWNSDDEFFRACLWVLSNKNMLDLLGQNAREKILNNYTWKIHVKKMEEFIDKKVSKLL